MALVASGNANGHRVIRRMELAFKDIAVKFQVNPEDYQQKEPGKSTLTHTKGGAWIDTWGAGVAEFQIRGITGAHKDDVGFNRWLELRDCIRALYASVTDGETIRDYLRLYNYTDGEFWYCWPMPDGFELTRSSTKPLIYQYTIQLWGLSRIGETVKMMGQRRYDEPIGPMPQTTSGGTKTTVSGGETYTTTKYVSTEAAISTETFSATRTTEQLVNSCERLSETLEPLVGGRDGRISPITLNTIVSGIYVTPYGNVTNSSINSGGGVIQSDGYATLQGVMFDDDGHLILGEDTPSILQIEAIFKPRVTKSAYEVWNLARKYDPKVMSPAYSRSNGTTERDNVISAILTSKEYDSEIIQYLAQLESRLSIGGMEASYIRTVVLDCVSIYLELYGFAENRTQLKLSAASMKNLISNIEAVILYFADGDELSVTRDVALTLVHHLRQLHSVMLSVNRDIAIYA